MSVDWGVFQELLDQISAEFGDLSGLSSYSDLAARFEQSTTLSGLREGNHGINDLERDLSAAYGHDQDIWLNHLKVVISAVPATQFPGYESWEGYFLRWDSSGSPEYAAQKYVADDAWLPVIAGEPTAGEPTAGEAAYIGAAAHGGAASDLSWVTPRQQQQFAAVRGDDWREWLPGQLDAIWSDWRAASTDVLPGWLDQWMPTLAPAAAPELDAAEIEHLAATVITPVLGQVQQDLGELASQLGVSTEQLAAEFARLTQEHPDRVAAAVLDGIRNAG